MNIFHLVDNSPYFIAYVLVGAHAAEQDTGLLQYGQWFDETPHRPHRPQIVNILLTSNRTGAKTCVYVMNSI